LKSLGCTCIARAVRCQCSLVFCPNAMQCTSTGDDCYICCFGGMVCHDVTPLCHASGVCQSVSTTCDRRKARLLQQQVLYVVFCRRANSTAAAEGYLNAFVLLGMRRLASRCWSCVLLMAQGLRSSLWAIPWVVLGTGTSNGTCMVLSAAAAYNVASAVLLCHTRLGVCRRQLLHCHWLFCTSTTQAISMRLVVPTAFSRSASVEKKMARPRHERRQHAVCVLILLCGWCFASFLAAGHVRHLCLAIHVQQCSILTHAIVCASVLHGTCGSSKCNPCRVRHTSGGLAFVTLGGGWFSRLSVQLHVCCSAATVRRQRTDGGWPLCCLVAQAYDQASMAMHSMSCERNMCHVWA
jgi:hypothetical protein